ncbi:MAG: DinB family protein [Planctomycetota bacterium]
MKAADYIKLTLEMSKQWIMGIAADAKDIPLQTPTSDGGNHALWCVGHLAYSDADLLSLATGEPNPLADWEGLFKNGTTPSDDPSIYPSFDEVMAKYEESHAALVAFVEGLSDEDLDKPSHAEGEMQAWFGTVAHCLAAIPTHLGFHGGQIADARRAAGRSPLMG